MFKAGIMSMQRIANYGSFLQAYGLKSMLENLGCDVQFVDYHPGEVLAPPERRTTGGVKFRKVIEIIQMKAPWRHKIQYLKYKKNYAANYYPYLGISDEKNYAPDLDLLIIGSDEVFNCLQSNPNVGFAPELFGEGQHAKTVITYAASFGNTTEEKLKQYGLEEKITPWLANFQAISVRDANSGIIIRSLTGKEPEYHLDPVLTYDFLNRCSGIPKEIPESNYMLLYGYSGRFTEGECAAIRAYARERRLQIFCLGGVQECCNRFIDCPPLTVITYFQRADCVVTDTFHGTILSIITHRNFVSLVREEGYGNSEKLSDLLLRLGLSDRKLNHIKELANLLDTAVDYTHTDEVIALEREKAKTYLKRFVHNGR